MVFIGFYLRLYASYLRYSVVPLAALRVRGRVVRYTLPCAAE